MPVLRQSDYRDPALIVESRESKTCRGCRHFVEQRVFDVSYMACKRDRTKHWRDDWQSRKCAQYDTGAE